MKKYLPYVVGFFLVSLLLKKVSGLFGFGSSEQDQEDINFQKINDSIVINDKSLLQNKAYYKGVAEATYTAMSGLGTDEETVFAVIKGLNSEELKQVFKDFGVRSSWLIFNGNLAKWYKDELSSSDYSDMRVLWANTNLLP
jgi:hypothetical protein